MDPPLSTMALAFLCICIPCSNLAPSKSLKTNKGGVQCLKKQGDQDPPPSNQVQLIHHCCLSWWVNPRLDNGDKDAAARIKSTLLHFAASPTLPTLHRCSVTLPHSMETRYYFWPCTPTQLLCWYEDQILFSDWVPKVGAHPPAFRFNYSLPRIGVQCALAADNKDWLQSRAGV